MSSNQRKHSQSKAGARKWIAAAGITAIVLAAVILILAAGAGKKPGSSEINGERDGSAAEPENATEGGELTEYRQVSIDQLEVRGELLLVNREQPLESEYSIPLTELRDWDGKVATVLYGDLRAMLAAGGEEGLRFVICSSYRSSEKQAELFHEKVQTLVAEGWEYEEAYNEVAKYTMPQGCSEHETGLALDIVSYSNQLLDESQEDTAETRWLHEHCQEFGFVLRYPEESSSVTGINYEPWHYRYVGKPHSYLMTQDRLCLEEYIEYLKGYPFDDKHLEISVEGVGYELYYCQGSEIMVPADRKYTVAGCGTDGFVVTVICGQ